MGKKVHPKAFRLNSIFSWDSKWFAKKKDFKKYLELDHDIKEYLNLEVFDLDDGRNFQVIMFALLGNYYPTTWSRLGAKVRTQHDLELHSSETGIGIYADLDFTKLDVNLEYEIGMRTDDDLGTIMDRDEERWQINVRKIF